ncbi:hypothetical protein [Streptomyces sp. NPDC046942]|uniref:hypothetical protein n=1 Tax=Streptomyces sp. NPDC046942 TaxID=3155137 RepID=UPI0033F11E0E
MANGMSVHRLGLITGDPPDSSGRTLTTLPWADAAVTALARYRQQQPGAEDLARVDAYQATPMEMSRNPHLKVRAIENELAHLLRTFIASPENTLGEDSARQVAYAAGLAHGTRRLSTFMRGQALADGPESMARWQDTAHASAGARHTSALFARYDHEVVEVTRTEDSFGSVGKQSPTTQAYFDGFIDGYKTVDPRLSHAEEFRREGPDGATEFVARFRYTPEK